VAVQYLISQNETLQERKKKLKPVLKIFYAFFSFLQYNSLPEGGILKYHGPGSVCSLAMTNKIKNRN